MTSLELGRRCTGCKVHGWWTHGNQRCSNSYFCSSSSSTCKWRRPTATIVNGAVGRGTWHWRGALPTLPCCRNQPKRQDGVGFGGGWGGAVAADSISPGPKGAAKTESSLLPPCKNGFHFAIVEVIPEPCPMSFFFFFSCLNPPSHCQNRDLPSERPFSHGRLVVSSQWVHSAMIALHYYTKRLKFQCKELEKLVNCRLSCQIKHQTPVWLLKWRLDKMLIYKSSVQSELIITNMSRPSCRKTWTSRCQALQHFQNEIINTSLFPVIWVQRALRWEVEFQVSSNRWRFCSHK